MGQKENTHWEDEDREFWDEEPADEGSLEEQDEEPSDGESPKEQDEDPASGESSEKSDDAAEDGDDREGWSPFEEGSGHHEHHGHHDHHEHHRHSSHGEGSRSRRRSAAPEETVYYDSKGRRHKKRRFAHSEYRHHYHSHRHGWKRVMLVVLTVFLFLGCGVFAAWRILDAMGKRALYKRDGAQAPTLAVTEEETAEETAGSGQTWKAGWVRHNGKVYEYNDEILTFLIMGIDDMNHVSKKSGGTSGGQADSLFLLVMNPKSGKINVVAINRNTMTEIDVYDEDGNFSYTGVGQICLAHGYGDGMEFSCELEEKAVSNLFYSLPLSGYVAINMGAVPMINDAVGGVVVPRMTFVDGQVQYGEDETLMGEDAFKYVHFRDLSVFDSAGFRLEKQKVYLRALMSKMMEAVREDPTMIVNLYQTISPYMVTDVDVSEVTYLAGQMPNYSLDLDTIYSLEGETTTGDQGFEEFTYDEDALYELMLEVFYEEVSEEEQQAG